MKNYPTTAVYSIEEIHNWVNVANNQIQTLHKEEMELIRDYSMNERVKEIINNLDNNDRALMVFFKCYLRKYCMYIFSNIIIMEFKCSQCDKCYRLK